MPVFNDVYQGKRMILRSFYSDFSPDRRFVQAWEK
jgi:hypothetical protein